MTVTEKKADKNVHEMIDRPWYFTFKFGHKYAHRYVKIEGSFIDARKKMSEYFGDDFSFQYTESSFLPLEIRYSLTEIKLTGCEKYVK